MRLIAAATEIAQILTENKASSKKDYSEGRRQAFEGAGGGKADRVRGCLGDGKRGFSRGPAGVSAIQERRKGWVLPGRAIRMLCPNWAGLHGASRFRAIFVLQQGHAWLQLLRPACLPEFRRRLVSLHGRP